MSWERRGVAAAVVTPLTVVSMHALCTLQAAWFGPSIVGAAASLVLPIVAAGIANWIKPAVATGVLTTTVVGGGLAAAGAVPWGFLPMLLLAGALCSVFTIKVGASLPSSVDGAWQRAKGKTIAWTSLAMVAVLQISRLSTFMADADNVWGSTFPPVEFTVGHMCMASYVHAADLTRQGDLNVYLPEHYPVFGLTEASDVHTSIEGLQPYFRDAYLYAPAFLLLPRAWLSVSDDYTHIRTVWFAIQFLAFVAFAVFLARWVGGGAGTWALWMLPLLLVSMPTMFNFQFGQAHLITIWTAMAAMVAFEVKRPALGGALLAWGITSKIFPGLLVLYLLLQKRWADVAWTAAFSAALVLLAVVVTGTEPAAAFTTYMLPRLVSGEAFSFVTKTLSVTTNLSIPGTVWKLEFLGIEGGRGMLGAVSVVYTVLLLAATWFAARLRLSRAGLVQAWLALLVLASLRSPIVPIYGAAPILWLMTFELDRVRSAKGLIAFGLSWLFISGVPPAPNPVVTIALFGVAQLAILYWVLKPLR